MLLLLKITFFVADFFFYLQLPLNCGIIRVLQTFMKGIKNYGEKK